MDLSLSVEELSFRDEVLAFLDEWLTEDLRRRARLTPTVFAEPDVSQLWQQILLDKGWLAYNWPKKYGGTGWSPVQRYIFERECALADAPDLPALSLKLLAPVIYTYGNERQKSELLPRILSGEDYWCQGFSEPQAGSDLAHLRMRAERQDNHYIVNGSKLWTTHAQFANGIFCLVRTNPDVKAQKGLSFLLISLDQPGVSIEPIISIAGDHEVNAVFFDNVMVPATDRIGDEGQGWSITKFLLENERGGSCHAPVILSQLKALRSLMSADTMNASGESFMEQPTLALKLAKLEFEAQALDMIELRIIAELSQGRRPGPQTSLVKMAASTLRQNVDALTMSVFGYAGLQFCKYRPLYGEACDGPVLNKAAQVAPARYLNDRAWTIFGGSNEIQKNIIAKTVLGL